MIEQIIRELDKLKIVDGSRVKKQPLTGGVSSFVWRLEDQSGSVVVKYPRQSMNLPEHWPVSVKRNRVEQAFFRYTSSRLPQHTPRIITGSRKNDWFCMGYLDGYTPWKELLLEGRFSLGHAREAAVLLRRLHGRSAGCDEAAAVFGDNQIFETMRLTPYFSALTAHYPEFSVRIKATAACLSATRRCLIHGDFSPKNLMLGKQMVMIDGETAVYGDPLFDVAFLINHLLLKGVLHPQKYQDVTAAVQTFAAVYGATREPARLVELILWLLLARVDGWSPVEYLNQRQRRQVRQFVFEVIQNPPAQLNGLLKRYVEWLKHVSVRKKG